MNKLLIYNTCKFNDKIYVYIQYTIRANFIVYYNDIERNPSLTMVGT